MSHLGSLQPALGTRPDGAAFDGTVQHSMALRDIRQLEQMTLRGIRWHSTRWRGIRWHGVAFEGTSRRSVAQPGGTARHSMALRGIRWLKQVSKRSMALRAFDGTRPDGAAFDGTVRHSMALRGTRWHGAAFDGTSRPSAAQSTLAPRGIR